MEVTIIDDEEARWDSSNWKEYDEDKKRPSSSNKRAKASKKKTKNGFSERAEEFCKELNISKEEYQKQVQRGFTYAAVRRVTTLVTVSLKPLMSWENAYRIKFA